MRTRSGLAWTAWSGVLRVALTLVVGGLVAGSMMKLAPHARAISAATASGVSATVTHAAA